MSRRSIPERRPTIAVLRDFVDILCLLLLVAFIILLVLKSAHVAVLPWWQVLSPLGAIVLLPALSLAINFGDALADRLRGPQ